MKELNLSLEQLFAFADRLDDAYERIFKLSITSPALFDQTLRKARASLSQNLSMIEGDFTAYLIEINEAYLRESLIEQLKFYKGSISSDKKIDFSTFESQLRETLPEPAVEIIKDKIKFFKDLIDCIHAIPAVLSDKKNNYWRTITETCSYVPGWENNTRNKQVEEYVYSLVNVFENSIKKGSIVQDNLALEVKRFLSLFNVRWTYIELLSRLNFTANEHSVVKFDDEGTKGGIVDTFNKAYEKIASIKAYDAQVASSEHVVELSQLLELTECQNAILKRQVGKPSSATTLPSLRRKLKGITPLKAITAIKYSLPEVETKSFLAVLYYIYEHIIDHFTRESTYFDAVIKSAINFLKASQSSVNPELADWLRQEIPAEFRSDATKLWQAVVYQGEEHVHHFEQNLESMKIPTRTGNNPHPNYLWIKFFFDLGIPHLLSNKPTLFETKDFKFDTLQYLLVLFNLRKIMAKIIRLLEYRVNDPERHTIAYVRPSRGILVNFELLKIELIELLTSHGDIHIEPKITNIFDGIKNLLIVINVLQFENLGAVNAEFIDSSNALPGGDDKEFQFAAECKKYDELMRVVRQQDLRRRLSTASFVKEMKDLHVAHSYEVSIMKVENDEEVTKKFGSLLAAAKEDTHYALVVYKEGEWYLYRKVTDKEEVIEELINTLSDLSQYFDKYLKNKALQELTGADKFNIRIAVTEYVRNLTEAGVDYFANLTRPVTKSKLKLLKLTQNLGRSQPIDSHRKMSRSNSALLTPTSADRRLSQMNSIPNSESPRTPTGRESPKPAGTPRRPLESVTSSSMTPRKSSQPDLPLLSARDRKKIQRRSIDGGDERWSSGAVEEQREEPKKDVPVSSPALAEQETAKRKTSLRIVKLGDSTDLATPRIDIDKKSKKEKEKEKKNEKKKHKEKEKDQKSKTKVHAVSEVQSLSQSTGSPSLSPLPLLKRRGSATTPVVHSEAETDEESEKSTKEKRLSGIVGWMNFLKPKASHTKGSTSRPVSGRTSPVMSPRDTEEKTTDSSSHDASPRPDPKSSPTKKKSELGTSSSGHSSDSLTSKK